MHRGVSRAASRVLGWEVLWVALGGSGVLSDGSRTSASGSVFGLECFMLRRRVLCAVQGLVRGVPAVGSAASFAEVLRFRHRVG
eukprot:15005177-Alexandrium_andersonii.AAC.2